ncbi:MAG: MOSC domain-containing protein [Burkholderiales bacterium]
MMFVKSIHIYPLKSCRGIDLQESELTRAGLRWDRNWMVVDDEGFFVTQRDLPRMARITTAMTQEALQIAAPGMSLLHIPLHDRSRADRRVVIWDHACSAFDEGDGAANWFSDFLGDRYRLVAFDPAERRISDRAWTGADEGLNRFSDGFPVLVISSASLADLNARLDTPIPMNRFRPNIVIDGIPAYDEDHLDTLTAGRIVLRVVKPCTRCEITTTDQDTGLRAAEPLQTLSGYRSNARMKGGITFGQNAIVTGGFGEMLSVGAPLDPRWTF